MNFAELLEAKRNQHLLLQKTAEQRQNPDPGSSTATVFNARGHLTGILRSMGIMEASNLTYDSHSVHPDPIANKNRPEIVRGPFKCTIKIRLPGEEVKAFTTEPFRTIKSAEYQASLLALAYLYTHPQYLLFRCEKGSSKSTCLEDFLEIRFGLSQTAVQEAISFEVEHEYPDEESTVNIGKLTVSLPNDSASPRIYTQRQIIQLRECQTVGGMRKELHERALRNIRESYSHDVQNDLVKCRKNGHILGKMKDFVFFVYPSSLMEDVASTLSSSGEPVGADGVGIRFCVNMISSKDLYDRFSFFASEENGVKRRAAYCLDCIQQSGVKFDALVDDIAFNKVCTECDRIGNQFPRQGIHDSLLCLERNGILIGEEASYKDPMLCDSWLAYVNLHRLTAHVDPNMDSISPEEVETLILKDQKGALSPTAVQKRIRYTHLGENDDLPTNKKKKKKKKTQNLT